MMGWEWLFVSPGPGQLQGGVWLADAMAAALKRPQVQVGSQYFPSLLPGARENPGILASSLCCSNPSALQTQSQERTQRFWLPALPPFSPYNTMVLLL